MSLLIDELRLQAKKNASAFLESLYMKTETSTFDSSMSRDRGIVLDEREILNRSLEKQNVTVQELQRELSSTVEVLHRSHQSYQQKHSQHTGDPRNLNMMNQGGSSMGYIQPHQSINSYDLVYKKEIEHLRSENKALREEVVLLRAYRVDAEGKLQFRLEQVKAKTSFIPSIDVYFLLFLFIF